MRYIQCGKCYQLEYLDVRAKCTNCRECIINRRPDNYYKGSNNFTEVDINLAKNLNVKTKQLL